MSDQITTALVQNYASGIYTLVQQKGSRLEARVRVEMLDAEFGFYDQVGAGVAQKRSSRHADTPYTPTPHARRRVAMEDYEYSDLLDKQDQIRLLNDPTNAYNQAAAFALGRVQDDILIAAAIGSSATGKTGSTPVSLPSGSKVAVAASGLTLAKLLAAKEILDAYENDPDEERNVALRAKDVTTLLNTTEVKSADYNTVKALVEGRINTFVGFNFIRTERINSFTATDGSSKPVLAWRKSALLLAKGSSIKGRIGERADKSYSTQVYSALSAGATRMEEEGVIEISVQA